MLLHIWKCTRIKTKHLKWRRDGAEIISEDFKINCDLGEVILETYPEMKVDVHHPDIRLNVEVREEIYLYSEIIPGPGGMRAVGTNRRDAASFRRD